MEELLKASGGLKKEKEIISLNINPTMMSQVKDLFQAVYNLAKRHKYKTAFVIVSLVIAKKSFNTYKWARDAFMGPIGDSDELASA
jgi:hypothetical protein